jgi:hypothetical protein
MIGRRPRRMGSCAGQAEPPAIWPHSARASAGASLEVLSATPTARTFGLGQARGLEVGSRQALRSGRARPGMPRMWRGRFVAHHQGVGLGAVQQAQRDAGEARVEQRALALDQVPAAVVAGGRELSIGAGDEVGDHRVDRHAAPAIRMPVWPVARKSALIAARRSSRSQGQAGVHLADRAVGADGQHPAASPAITLADRHVSGVRARRTAERSRRAAASAMTGVAASFWCRPEAI